MEFLDTSNWELLSKRAYSINRYSPDGKWVAKVFLDEDTTTTKALENHRDLARNARRIGINTPEVGDIYDTSEGQALLFQCVHNKKSCARAISEDPDNMEKYMEIMARNMRRLHSTVSDKAVFPSQKLRSIEWANKSTLLNDEDKAFAVKVFEQLEDADTSLLFDMHPGNIIFGDEGEFFIDLGMLSWGSPLFDVADFWNVCHVMDEDITKDLIHLDRKMLLRCWDVFCWEYYGIDSQAGRDELEAKLMPYELSVHLMVEAMVGIYDGLQGNLDMRMDYLKRIYGV